MQLLITDPISGKEFEVESYSWSMSLQTWVEERGLPTDSDEMDDFIKSPRLICTGDIAHTITMPIPDSWPKDAQISVRRILCDGEVKGPYLFLISGPQAMTCYEHREVTKKPFL